MYQLGNQQGRLGLMPPGVIELQSVTKLFTEESSFQIPKVLLRRAHQT